MNKPKKVKELKEKTWAEKQSEKLLSMQPHNMPVCQKCGYNVDYYNNCKEHSIG